MMIIPRKEYKHSKAGSAAAYVRGHAGVCLLLCCCLCLVTGIRRASAAKDTVAVPEFENGMAQPILNYTNLRDVNYTNEGSDILRFCVYVETDYDTDSDGKADLVEVLVQVPRSAAEGAFKAATIYDPTPYGAGTVDENPMNSVIRMNPVPFDYSRLYEPGSKRTPKGCVTTLDASEAADPESWNYSVPFSNEKGYSYARLYDYYLVRGFAVVEAGGIGTYHSEGYELCGLDLERDAHKCVVEWLAGDRIAFTDPYNNIEIKAEWSNGNVAMTGCSYGGTIPFEVAATGVKGLKTIIPYAGIASWYDYTNSQGISRFQTASYVDGLASYNSGAAYLDDDWTVINDEYASLLWQLSQDQMAANGNYDEFWSSRDYSLDSSRINCSALIVHGMNDLNVFTKQADLMVRAFAGAGQPWKLVLHQDGHNDLYNMLVNGELWEETVNKWLSHFLYGVENGIEDMPSVTVQSNVDGSFRTYDSWGEFESETFAYNKTVNPDEVSHVNAAGISDFFTGYTQSADDFGRPLLQDNYYLCLPEGTCAYYVFEVPDDYTIYGVPEVHLRMSTPDADKDAMMVTAALIDTIDGETGFKAYLTKTRLDDCVPRKTIGEVETGPRLARTKVKWLVQSNATAKLITLGYTDLQNYGGGYEGRDYTKREEPMTAGAYYDYTIYLQPTVYTFEPGHRAILVITGWDPYIECYSDAAGTLKPRSYSFDIDNAALEFRFPLCASSSP